MLAHSMKSEPKTSSWRKISKLAKDYFFHSNQKLVAWLYVIGIALCVIGLVALMALFGWWSVGFWAVLAAKALTPFFISMGQFALLVTAYVSVHVLKNYLIDKLAISWRNWLTHKIINNLLRSNNYLTIKDSSQVIDNVPQRVQEDIKSFVYQILYLGSDLLKSVLSLATFVGTLWVVGGALVIGTIAIPGYLVWVAVGIAILATVITHVIAKSLAHRKQQAERAEADLREELGVLNDEADNIAEEHAEKYYDNSLKNKVEIIKHNALEKLTIQSRLVAFQNFYSQVSWILPNVLAAPLYFTGQIQLGQLMQIGMSFGQVSNSLSWFVNAYSDLAACETSGERIKSLEDACLLEELPALSKKITRKEEETDALEIKDLTITLPSSKQSQSMMAGLTMKLKAKEHVLIKGPSGLGKSTLFKVIAGSWQYGCGEITMPAGKKMYFLPQRPTLPNDTLKAVLAYPDPAETYTNADYIAALDAVGDMADFKDKLNDRFAWSKILSGGQQQRISFARVLLKKPDWLFLDEATASLDELSEDKLYHLVTQLDTTVVSIAHRQTVEKFHRKILFFSASDDKKIEITEDNVAAYSL